MWIFCGGMPRSGSTLQFQLAAHLVERAGLGHRVAWAKPDQFPALRDQHADRATWKVLKSHALTDAMRRELDAGNARAVYVYRDLRDVVVSRMRKRNESFDSLWQACVVDSLLAGFERWTSIAGILVSRYEDMVVDVPGEVSRIASHLGIETSTARCAEIADEYSEVRQRERIREAQAAGRLAESDGFRFDPVSNLHVDHFHSGKSGDWRVALRREQTAMIEERAKDWLLAHGYPLSMTDAERASLVALYAPRAVGEGAR